MKYSYDTIGNRTSDLPVCCAVLNQLHHRLSQHCSHYEQNVSRGNISHFFFQ
jgi:hypothetical protein